MAKAANFKIIFAIICSIVMLKCANQLPPGGGPIDKTPPKIIEIFPADGTINYHENYFEITFSEYVDKRSVIESIFISPSVEGQKEYDWSGRTLRVSFRDSLKKNTTYTITIGTDVKDINNGNKMAEAVTFAFSTGDKIYNGTISGKVYGNNISGTMIFAYKILKDSSVNPLVQKPDFISQVGNNGFYKLVGISDGVYRVFAILDKYRDLKYNPQDDMFGCYSSDILLNEKDNQKTGIDFQLSMTDTTLPKITFARMTDKNHILVEFNKSIDSVNTRASNFYLFDSTINLKIIPKYFFKGQARKNQYSIAFENDFSENDRVFLFSRNIPDLQNNHSKLDSLQVYVVTKPDTMPVRLIKKEGIPIKEKLSFTKPIVNLVFNDAIDSASFLKALSFFGSKNESYPIKINRIDDANFLIEIDKKLKPNTNYQLKVDMSELTDISGNKLDTVITLNFVTDSELDYSAVTGSIKNLSVGVDAYAVLDNTGSEGIKYKSKVQANGAFEFNKILPGKYLLWYFIDKNNNGKYDNGKVYPFEPSEKFSYYADTLNVRARWPIGDVVIQ
ncbi:Ig-like domain-containing protein [Melioribacteraceae bacterium 4301-Me]|uniref:Ig-like domain-containing protein n=1 Tax=Pyranulibacter aquaticus TaxID=3163344 RepID=UPI00359964F4